MASGNGMSRRKALLAAGAAGLGVLGVAPSRAEASKYKRLDRALEEMREAKKFLQKAPKVFGGHRKKAIEALNVAMDEIEQAIKFAERG